MNPNGDLVTADNFEVAPNLVHLYRHLLENGFIESMEGYNPSYLPIKSSDVLAKIRAGAGLGGQVSPEVAKIIKERQLFGYPSELVARTEQGRPAARAKSCLLSRPDMLGCRLSVIQNPKLLPALFRIAPRCRFRTPGTSTLYPDDPAWDKDFALQTDYGKISIFEEKLEKAR